VGKGMLPFKLFVNAAADLAPGAVRVDFTRENAP